MSDKNLGKAQPPSPKKASTMEGYVPPPSPVNTVPSPTGKSQAGQVPASSPVNVARPTTPPPPPTNQK